MAAATAAVHVLPIHSIAYSQSVSGASTEIEFLKGVGPVRGEALRKETGVSTWEDLLNYFPFRYMDRSTVVKVRDIQSDAVYVQLIGQLVRLTESGDGRRKRLDGIFRDESGDMELCWFQGIKWLKDNLKLQQPYVIYGKPSEFKGRYSIVHPEMELLETARITTGSPLRPVYSSTEKLTRLGHNSTGIARLTLQLTEDLRWLNETLPEEWLDRFGLMPRSAAYRQVHVPTGHADLDQARKRLKFEELFFIQLGLGREKLLKTRQQQGVVFAKVGDYFNTFFAQHLPFALTGAQKRVVREIRNDAARGYHMNRLLQGDVGSGKTIVAVLAALLAADNGFQACLMAPTEILAQQHYQGISELLHPLTDASGLHFRVALLTGSTPKSKRQVLLQELERGEIHLLIGTHALIEPAVKFSALGLAIIDEQHRFGVAQRAALWNKHAIPPHVLVMTATPIPRTLAMTVYGDLDISVLDELPPGRKPIKTTWTSDAARLRIFQFMEDEIKKSRQVYVVYPLIEESAKLDLKHLMDGFESISRRFPLPQYQVSIVHGRMKQEDRDYEMARFVKGQTQIMVATTVIEVGVNVPNASVMVIESAERFGLSQLHQLRGRVGRGADQSHCILVAGHKLSHETRKRLQTMCDTNDGFKIAEVDLELRGPGDMMGTQQSGVINLKIADLVRDRALMEQTRELALELLTEDPSLSDPAHMRIRMEWALRMAKNPGWSRIS
jgi:ATP-dependent DNA helicase RecG